MKWIIMSLFLMAMTPIYYVHDKTDKIDDEFKNYSDNLQSRQFTVFTATPTFQELQEGEIVIISSFQFSPVALMLRVGATAYVTPYFSPIKGR